VILLDTDLADLETLASSDFGTFVADYAAVLRRAVGSIVEMRAELRALRPEVAEREILKWVVELVRKHGRGDARAKAAIEVLQGFLSTRPA